MISIGNLVAINQIACEYAGVDFESDKTGVVVSIKHARKIFNLDTDELLCEVIVPSGDLCIFYETDLKLIER